MLRFWYKVAKNSFENKLKCSGIMISGFFQYTKIPVIRIVRIKKVLIKNLILMRKIIKVSIFTNLYKSRSAGYKPV